MNEPKRPLGGSIMQRMISSSWQILFSDTSTQNLITTQDTAVGAIRGSKCYEEWASCFYVTMNIFRDEKLSHFTCFFRAVCKLKWSELYITPHPHHLKKIEVPHTGHTHTHTQSIKIWIQSACDLWRIYLIFDKLMRLLDSATYFA